MELYYIIAITDHDRGEAMGNEARKPKNIAHNPLELD